MITCTPVSMSSFLSRCSKIDKFDLLCSMQLEQQNEFHTLTDYSLILEKCQTYMMAASANSSAEKCNKISTEFQVSKHSSKCLFNVFVLEPLSLSLVCMCLFPPPKKKKHSKINIYSMRDSNVIVLCCYCNTNHTRQFISFFFIKIGNNSNIFLYAIKYDVVVIIT